MTLNKTLLSVLFAVPSVCLPAMSAEPNAPQVELRFDLSDSPRQWVRNRNNEPGAGPIEPTHVAEVILFAQSQQRYSGEPREINQLKATAAGSSISEKQIEFLTTSDAFAPMQNGVPIRNHRPYLLYAVTVDDARAMAQAFVELSATAAREEMNRYLERRGTSQAQVAACQKLIPELEAKLQTAAARKQELESRVRYLGPAEAITAAQEMNSLLNNLRIEIEGIEARIEYIRQSQAAEKNSQALNYKLQEMLIVETTTLKGALARQKAAEAIRQEDADYINAVNERASLEKELEETRHELEKAQRELSNAERDLANPHPHMLPPVIYQNKVTIYLVQQGGYR